MRVRLKTRKRVPKSRKRRIKNMKSKKMRGGSAPMSEWGNVFSNLGYLSQSALNQFSVPIPTIAGQTSSSPLMTQQFPLIKPLLLD
jgi:hypothetical protein